MRAPGTLTPAFTRASAQPAASTIQRSGSSTDRAPEIIEKRDHVLNHAKEHFAERRSAWIVSQYAKLLRQDAPAPALRPIGMQDDRKTVLLRAAAHLVDKRQSRRIQKITACADRMISGKDRDDVGR